MGKSKYQLDRKFIIRFHGLMKILFPNCTSLTAVLNILFLAILMIEQFIIYNVGLIPSAFYQVLSDRDQDGFTKTLWRSLIIVSAISLVRSCKQYISSVLYITWRQLLGRASHSLYFTDVIFYKLNVLGKHIDNPDQRMTQDIDKFCQLLSEILAPIIVAPFTIGYYSYQAYCNAGWIGPTGCFIYFLFSTFLNKLFMSPIVSLVVEQEKKEGDFRFKHLQVRVGAESLAFSQANFYESFETNKFLDDLISTQQKIFDRRLFLNTAINFFDYSGSVLSYIILSIPIFAGKYFDLSASQLSALISQNAFVCMYLISSFSSLVDQSSKFADLAGVIHRISELLETMVHFHYKRDKKPECIDHVLMDRRNVSIEVKNLSVCPPGSNRIIVKNLTFSVKLGENLLITGPSSSGKTSILRHICGIWPNKNGEICYNSQVGSKEILFLPQKPYFTSGTLKDQLVFPLRSCDDLDNMTDKKLFSYLKLLQLDVLTERLGGLTCPISGNWNDILSPGEMQRLCFIRLFYHKPKVAVLDEMTSALSLDVEKILYAKCHEYNITCISVGHRSSLHEYHDKLISLNGDGEWTYSTIENKSQQ